MNPKVDRFLAEGCGRCPLVRTPQCKALIRRHELLLLRDVLLGSGLTEELKWSQPCYTYNEHNILIMSALNNGCSISFFKGVFIDDRHGALMAETEHMQSSRILRFTSEEEVRALTPALVDYIQQAIDIERTGQKVVFN